MKFIKESIDDNFWIPNYYEFYGIFIVDFENKTYEFDIIHNTQHYTHHNIIHGNSSVCQLRFKIPKNTTEEDILDFAKEVEEELQSLNDIYDNDELTFEKLSNFESKFQECHAYDNLDEAIREYEENLLKCLYNENDDFSVSEDCYDTLTCLETLEDIIYEVKEKISSHYVYCFESNFINDNLPKSNFKDYKTLEFDEDRLSLEIEEIIEKVIESIEYYYNTEHYDGETKTRMAKILKEWNEQNQALAEQ